MPGLVAFKRRWETGSDDLVIPCFILGLIHLILFIVISIYLTTTPQLQWGSYNVQEMIALNANQSDITKAICATEIKYFSFGYLGLLIAAVLLEIVMVGFSMQGTIMDPEPRKPLQYLIYIRIVLGIVEVVYTIAVAIKISQDWRHCESMRGIFNVQAAIVGVNAIVIIVVILTALCTFDPSGGSFYRFEQAVHGSSDNVNISHMRTELNQKRQKFWRRAFAKCFCCRLGSSNTQAALDDVARIFSDFFCNHDLVPSDIVAGFVLLRHKQQRAQEEIENSIDNPIKEFMCGRPITDSTMFLDHNQRTEAHEFSVMTYYCQYAVASYGPLMYMYSHIACGVCNLMEECMCGADRTSCCASSSSGHRHFASSTIHNDTCCEWRTAAIRRTLLDSGLRGDVDLVYISWNNDLYKQPFFVAVDHKMEAIVVTIRGTLSDLDALTDIVATPMQIPGADPSWKAHKGIVQGAMHIRQQLLDEEMILSQAFGRDLSRGTRDYKLVIVGHSLGAGVATILAILLKSCYPQLSCYCYAPPGGLLSMSAMEGSKHYINTAVLGKDLITRTSISQLEKMRNEIISLLKNTNLPKYRLILGNLFHSTKKRELLLQQNRPIEEEERNLVSNQSSQDVPDVASTEDLFPPGRIIHVVYRTSPPHSGCCSTTKKKKQYFAIESDNMSDFSEILISHQMVSHHFPGALLEAMHEVRKQTPFVADSRKYTESETLPVGGITRNGKTRRSDLAEHKKPEDQQTNSTMEALNDSVQHNTQDHVPPQEHSAMVEATDEQVVAPLARMDSFSESGSSFGVESPTAGSSSLLLKQQVDAIKEVDEQEPYRNLNNSSHQGQASSSTSEAPKSHDQSMLHHFGDYIDVVLTQPQILSTNAYSSDTASELRYSRSMSVPTRPHAVAVNAYTKAMDKDMVRRARFEPNLIPKPPRSHSVRLASRSDDC